MIKKTALLLSLVVGSHAYGGWGISDLDPFNRNSGIRRTFAGMDPSKFIATPKGQVLHKVANVVANEGQLKSKADKEGWNMEKCRTAGVGIATAIAGFQATAICAAYVAGEPVSTTACVGLIVASGATITEIACTQLCNDHHLRDC